MNSSPTIRVAPPPGRPRWHTRLRFVARCVGFALAGALAACATAAQKTVAETTAARAAAHSRMPERLASLAGATADCEPSRTAGVQGWTAAAECYDRHLVAAFIAADPPYAGSLFLTNAHRLATSDRVVRGVITPDQARGELDAMDKGLAASIRATIKPPELTPRQKELSQDLAINQELLQRQADTETLLKAFEALQPRP